MTIDAPTFLHDFSQASGSTITNLGTAATPYVIAAQSVESDPDFTWHTTAGQFRGYLDVLKKNGADMVGASTAQTAPGGSLQTTNVMIAFSLRSLGTSSQSRLVSKNGEGDVEIYTAAPTSNDFDLTVTFNSAGSLQLTTTFASLLFNTNYIVSANLSFSGATATGIAKLGSNAFVTLTGTTNWTADSLALTWPYLFRRADFSTNHFGCDGKFSAFAYQRGGNAWSSTDLGSINADPSVIPGWTVSTGQPAGKRFGGIPNIAGGRKGVWRERLSGILVPAWPKTIFEGMKA